MSLLFAAAGAGLYAAVSGDLLDELDTGLRARAATMQADLSGPAHQLLAPSPALLELTEEFTQIVGRDATLIDSSPGVGLALPQRLAVSISTERFFQQPVPGVVGTARILALPALRGSTPVTLIVGASMSDRSDALHRITVVLATGGPLGVLLASAAGWLLAGTALRPIDRMRRQASAISASGPDRRLTVPAAHDEFRRLAQTLNEMLTRLDVAMRSQHRFLDHASHELRTPLSALRTELDLALLQPRSQGELLAAVHSASEEADRLCRMAEDLLTLSRAQQPLPLYRAPVSLRELLSASARMFRPAAAASGVRIDIDAPDVTVHLDQARIRQALDNLLANAIRHAPTGTAVDVHADVYPQSVQVSVTDCGQGFMQQDAFEPFQGASRAAPNRPEQHGSGLGLAIVRAVMERHGGTARIGQVPTGGGRVVLTLPMTVTRYPGMRPEAVSPANGRSQG